MTEITAPMDLVPSITKDLLDQKTESREAYVPPRVEDLGNIESTTFQASIILH